MRLRSTSASGAQTDQKEDFGTVRSLLSLFTVAAEWSFCEGINFRADGPVRNVFVEN